MRWKGQAATFEDADSVFRIVIGPAILLPCYRGGLPSYKQRTFVPFIKHNTAHFPRVLIRRGKQTKAAAAYPCLFRRAGRDQVSRALRKFGAP